MFALRSSSEGCRNGSGQPEGRGELVDCLLVRGGSSCMPQGRACQAEEHALTALGLPFGEAQPLSELGGVGAPGVKVLAVVYVWPEVAFVP